VVREEETTESGRSRQSRVERRRVWWEMRGESMERKRGSARAEGRYPVTGPGATYNLALLAS
jgi:hypothetical protein